MATNMDEEQSLRECEAYVQMHGRSFLEYSLSLEKYMVRFSSKL